MAQLRKSKPKGVKKRGPSSSQRVAEQRDRYWAASPQQLEEAGISDADLRVLSPADEFPEAQELGKLYEESFNQAYHLERELIEIIKASTFDANSRKAVTQMIRDYGKARERHGASAAQFEFRGVDQYQRAIAGKNRGSGKRKQGPREQRLDLMTRWAECNGISEEMESPYSLSTPLRVEVVQNWMRKQNPKVSIPVEKRTWERDWEEVLIRIKAKKAGGRG